MLRNIEGGLMSHLALNIDMKSLPVLVAGGGRVAERKIRTLMESGADVSVVAPEVTAGIAALEESGAISLRKRCYESRDIEDIFLVVAATNDGEVNQRIAADARQRRILAVVTDRPEKGNCSFPAMLRRGNLEIGVSTQGKCPAFASEIRDLIATVINEEYGMMLERLAAEREKLLTEGTPSTYNSAFLRSRSGEIMSEFMNNKERVS